MGSAVLLLFAALGVVGVAAAAEAPPSFQELEESLTCQCGCGLTVHSCNHLQCDSALPLRAEIRTQMQTGKDKQAILAYFAGKYGEKILSAPTTAGFNLFAWIVPFVLVGLGAAVVAATALRWGKRGRPPGESAPAQPSTVASPYADIIEKELKRFDG